MLCFYYGYNGAPRSLFIVLLRIGGESDNSNF